jgi:hypothetical protein
MYNKKHGGLMEIIMANGTFRLKSRELYARGLATRAVKNKQDVANKSGWSYSTASKWIEDPENLTGVDFDNLAVFLFDVLGMSPEDVMNSRFGDIFNLIPKASETTKAE